MVANHTSNQVPDDFPIYTKVWQNGCKLASKDKKSSLNSFVIKRLSELDVKSLWTVIQGNVNAYAAPYQASSMKTLRSWLLSCATTITSKDSGNLLKETLGRLEASMAPRSSNEDTTLAVHREQTAGEIFPALGCVLRSLPKDGMQLDDCVQETISWFAEIAYTALDIYHYYRPTRLDPEPCPCQLEHAAEQLIDRGMSYEDTTVLYPSYFTSVLKSVNRKSLTRFLFEHVIPKLYLGSGGTEIEILDGRLWTWLTAASVNRVCRLLDLEGGPRADPGALSSWYTDVLEKVKLRGGNTQVRQVLPLLDAARARAAGMVDVPVTPAGPLIDVHCHATQVSDVTKEAMAEEKCLICQYTFGDDDGEACVKLGVCDHAFHTDCLGEWINSRTTDVTCPTCRASICASRPTRKGCVYCE